MVTTLSYAHKVKIIILIMEEDSDVSTDELIENAIQMGREGIVDLKKMIEENSDIEEDF